MPTGGGGGDAAPADSGADASVRLAGRTARTRLRFHFLENGVVMVLNILQLIRNPTA
jgi:hypothetical protein